MNVCLVLNVGNVAHSTPLPVVFKYWPLVPADPPAVIVLSSFSPLPSNWLTYKCWHTSCLKLRVVMSAPKTDVAPPPVILIPLTNKLLPSNVKLLLSCNLPPVPASYNSTWC